MSRQELLERARLRLAFAVGGLSASPPDFIAVGAELRGVFCELAKECGTREHAKSELATAWGHGPLPVPGPAELIFRCWGDTCRHPEWPVESLVAAVGALYLLCVEGRLPREQALDLSEAWDSRVPANAPGGVA